MEKKTYQRITAKHGVKFSLWLNVLQHQFFKELVEVRQ